MSAALAPLLTFLSLAGAALAGARGRERLQASLSNPSTDAALRRAAWIIGTLTAVMLAALVVYLKIHFDTANREVRAFSFQIVDLDNALRRLGQQGEAPRALLFRYAARTTKDVWPDSAVRLGPGDYNAGRIYADLEGAIARIRTAPEISRTQVNDISQLVRAVGRGRWTLDERAGRALSPWTLAIIVTWMIATFGILGLSIPRSRLALGVLGVTAAVLASAVFLVVEYANPFEGIIIVSSEPMRTALFALSE